MISALIVDDEPNNVIILANLLQDFCPKVTVIGDAGNVPKAEALIRETGPDLVFLDIEMPYGSGFDLLDKLRPVNFEIIFVTAFNEYTLRAFRYSALDYLLKPINISELQQSVNKAEQNIQLKNFDRRLDSFLENFKRSVSDIPKIALPGKNGVVFIPMTDIIRCEGSRGYTSIFIRNKGKIISSKNMKEYEALLPEEKFYRVHNSHLVNISCISGYQRGRGGYIEMEDGAVIEVAVRRKDELMVRLGLSYNV
jgi:two-component system LytT family response regulator